MPRLHSGDPFPAVTIRSAGGHTITLPEFFHGHWAVVLFEHQERGCPYCAAQFQGFRQHAAHLRREGVQVVALSERGDEPTRRWPWQTRPALETFGGEAVTRLLHDVGQDMDEAGTRLHSTAAVVRPNGTVELALYASGPQGHLSPTDALGLILSQR